MACYTADIRKLVVEFYAFYEIQMSVSLFCGVTHNDTEWHYVLYKLC